MNFDLVMKRAAGSTELFLKKHGPEILTGLGVAGFAATTYLVGKAVLKAQEPIAEAKKAAQEIANKQVTDEYTEKDRAREIGKFWIVEGAKIVRIFTPAIAAGSISVACVIASHGLMRRQQASLAAAYIALERGFAAYRQRVREELGEEKEDKLFHDVRTRKILIDEDMIEACEIDPDDVQPSLYAKFFDESNPNWSKTPEWNLMFIRSQEKFANDRLNAYGFVFLNEVYEWLGLERTQAGQIVGWKKNGKGDNFISFGIYDIADESSRAFVNGLEASVLLDFNPDGPITI